MSVTNLSDVTNVTNVTANDRNSPIHSEAAPLTVNDVIDAYMRNRRDKFAKRPCQNPDSLEAHFVAVRERFGAMPVKEFRKGSMRRVEEAVAEWRAPCEARPAGLKAGTVRKRVSQLKTAFNFAVKTELIKRKHLPAIELPAQGPPRERFVDPVKELPVLLTSADDVRTPDHIRLQTELLIRLGCRRGALLKLQWSRHVDFERRLILLRETQTAEERQGNKKKRENQPIDDELYEILMDAKDRATCDFVISWRGRPIKSTYSGQASLYRRAGIKNLTTHDLRRSSATYVYNELEGDLEKAAAHIADTKEMAERTYIQKDPNVKLPGMRAVGAVLARARGEDEEAA